MAPRKARAARAARAVARLETVAEPKPLLQFDFNGAPKAPASNPPLLKEKSSIKDAIVRWLEQQL